MELLISKAEEYWAQMGAGVRDIWIRMTTPAELKGEWELGCLVAGHYEHGVKAELLVE